MAVKVHGVNYWAAVSLLDIQIYNPRILVMAWYTVQDAKKLRRNHFERKNFLMGQGLP